MYETTTTTTTDPAATAGGGVMLFIYLAILLLLIVSMWKIFTKAGKPGWASIIPIYNLYVLLQIIGRPGWWILLYFIPFVNIVVALINALDLAKSFGKSSTFGVLGLFLFSFVGYPMLAFGDANYQGPAVSDGQASPSAPTQTPPTQAPPSQTPPTTPSV